MENDAWFFVAAAFIGAIAVSFLFRQMMTAVEDVFHSIPEEERSRREEALQKAVTNFFIKVPLFEVPAIILIILGFINITETQGQAAFADIMPQFILVLAALLTAALLIVPAGRKTLTHPELPDEQKNRVRTMMLVALPLAASLPFISIVALILMVSG